MRNFVISLTLLHLVLGASIPIDITCPYSCTCNKSDITCPSYEFIKKLNPKQTKLSTLTINNANLVNVDSKLKYLKNLQGLDLSNNAIAMLPSEFPYLPKLKTLNLSSNYLNTISFAQLPKSLQILDLSNNSIENFPEDWNHLQQLTTVYLRHNPINCDCENLHIYEQLLKSGIVIPDDLTCFYPKEFHGHLLNTVNCTVIKEKLLNAMLGDEAGSGLEDFHIGYENQEEEQFINAEDITQLPEDLDNIEGSGFEGSGFIPILPIPKKTPACIFNCSTPAPVGSGDEQDASPPPPIKEQVNILFEDIFQPASVQDINKTPNTTTSSSTTEKALKEVEEPILVKESDKDLVETFPTNVTGLGEMERASLNTSSNNSVYIVVGLLIAFVAFLIIYYVNKKKKQRRKNLRKRNKPSENGFGEEMKPLGKSAEKPIEQNNAKPLEAAPLLNGQNGKLNGDAENHVQPPSSDDLEEVELRKPNDTDVLLTPQLERVTIKAGELPDSIPKTPLFVHRSVNSDGEIITTAVNSN